VGWYELPPGSPTGDIVFATSQDGGRTFLDPVPITNDRRASYDDPVVLAASGSDDVYVVYGSAIPGGDPAAEDVFAALSTDGGRSFQPGVRLDDEPSCASHAHPAATLDSAGDLWVIWYDARFGDGRVRWTRARPGAAGDPLAVVDAGWVAGDGAGPFTTARDQFFLGDYIGIDESGGRMVAVWTDLREAATAGPAIYFSTAQVR
jgi:hypothetical protein